ncbi:MAG: MarR family transcriptional regulator [Xanthomonadales bacterium]|nr:MarR family transcriptional regulator [Xanthomonadales bacterium]
MNDKPTTDLLRLTQRKLLRHLLAHPQGATIEDLCRALNISHNAVRQHLTALIARGYVRSGESIPSGGRPRAVYMLDRAGRELFPRNYALIAQGMLEHLYANGGPIAVQDALSTLGARLGQQAAASLTTAHDADEATRLLAEQLDALGYEAEVIGLDDGHTEVQAWNCVFHTLARQHPDVCQFDLAFMRAATGREVHRSHCMLHGQPSCRFRLGARKTHHD